MVGCGYIHLEILCVTSGKRVDRAMKRKKRPHVNLSDLNVESVMIKFLYTIIPYMYGVNEFS